MWPEKQLDELKNKYFKAGQKRHMQVYTMNKPDVAAAIRNHLAGMLGKAF